MTDEERRIWELMVEREARLTVLYDRRVRSYETIVARAIARWLIRETSR